MNRSRPRRVLDQLGGGVTNPREFAALDEKIREENRKEWKKTTGYGGRWNNSGPILSDRRGWKEQVEDDNPERLIVLNYSVDIM